MTELDQLMKRRQELADRIEQITNDFRQGLPADSQERALELQNRDTLHEIRRVAAEELAKVENAIREVQQQEG